jgi:hypothetical protein
MWTLFKTLVFLGLLGAAAYGIFFVPVGGATIATHAKEIWRSTIVQDKVRRVRDGVEDRLAHKLDRALANKSGANANAEPDISDADRKQLENLIRGAK